MTNHIKTNYFCGKNIGTERLQLCGKPAKTFYQHNDDICCYCEEHDYCCGTPIDLVTIKDNE